MRDKTVGFRVSEQEKKKIKRMALKRGFADMSAFIFWLIHQARIGKIILVLSLGFWLSGCATTMADWFPEHSKAKSLEKMVEIERQKLELEKQKLLLKKQSNQNPTK